MDNSKTNDHPKRGKTEITPYMKWVRCVISTELNRRGISLDASLLEKLNKHAKKIGMGTIINNSTYTKLLNADQPLNLHHATVICDFLDYDVSKLLNIPEEFPDNMGNTAEERYAVVRRYKKTQPLKPLSNANYEGVYFGYMYPTNFSTGYVDRFELKLDPNTKYPKATLTMYIQTSENGEIKTNTKIFSGDPKILDGNALYIEMTSNGGSYFIITFYFRDFEGTPLHFKQGVVITNARSDFKHPEIQTAVIYRKEPEDKEAIHGLLKLGGESFTVSEEEYKKLIADEKVEHLLKNHPDCAQGVKRYYEIKYDRKMLETEALADRTKTLEGILKLKSRSTLPTHFGFFDRYDYYELAKNTKHTHTEDK